MAKGTIKAKIELEGADKYKEQLKSIAIAEKELQSEMKKAQAQYKGMESSTEALAKKKELLVKQIELEGKKLAEQQKMVQNAAKAQEEYATRTDTLKKVLEEAKKGTGELSDEQRKAAEAAGAQVKTVEELEQAIEKSEKQYEAAGRAMSTYQTACNNTETSMIELNGQLIDTEKTMLGVTDESEESAKGLKEVGQSAGESSKDLKGMGDIIKANIISDAIISGLKALAKGITEVSKAAISTGMEFEASMSKVAATMGMTSREIQNGSKDYEKLEAAAKKCGETTMFSASEAAEALNYLALAGYDASKAAETLPKVLDLAAAGGMDLATASDLVTDSMAALGMQTSELDTYIDEMAKTAQKSNTSVQQLGEATLVCAGMAKTAGVDLEEMNTALGVLANNGIKGAEGGTHLRNVLIALSAPTDKAAAALKDLGVETVDAGGNMRSLEDILKDLNASMADMGSSEKAQAIRTIFNKTDISAVNALLKSTNGEFSELKTQIENAKGAASGMADTMNNNLKGQLTILKSNLEALGISAYQVFDGELKEGVRAASEAVQRLNESVSNGDMHTSLNKLSEALGKFIERGADLAEDVLPDIIDAIAWCADNFDVIIAGVTGIVTATLMMKTVVPLINAAQAAWIAHQMATTSAEASQLGLNAAMAANPIGLVITAVAALTAGLSAYLATADFAIEKDEKLNEEQKKLVDSARAVANANKSAAEDRQKDIASMEAKRTVTARLIASLKEHVDADGKLIGEEGKVMQIVQELNEAVPELGIAYDTTSQSINMSTAELEKNTEALMAQAKAAAVQEQLTQIYRERIDTEIELAKLEDEKTAAEERAMIMAEKYHYYQRLLNEAQEQGATESIAMYTAEMERVKAAWEEAVDAAIPLKSAYGDLENGLDSLSEEEQILQGMLDETSAAMEGAGSAADGYSDAVAEAAEEISDSWAEMHDSTVAAIQGQISIFEEYSGATKHTKEEVLKNMQEQVNALRDWSQNLQELSRKGVSEGMLQELAKMGPEGAGYVQAFLDMAPAQLKEASALFDEATVIPEETLTAVEENWKEFGSKAYEGVEEGASEGAEDAKESMGEQAEEVGNCLPEGIIEGIENKQSGAWTAAEEMAKGVEKATGEKITNPIYAKYGNKVPEGVADGTREKIKVAQDAAVEMANEVKKTMAENMDSEEFFSLGEQAGQGFVEGILSKIPDVQAAAAQLASIAAAATAAANGNKRGGGTTAQSAGQEFGDDFINGFQASTQSMNDMINGFGDQNMESSDNRDYSINTTVTNNFTINADGQDPEEIAAAVQDMINDQFNSERSAFA